MSFINSCYILIETETSKPLFSISQELGSDIGHFCIGSKMRKMHKLNDQNLNEMHWNILVETDVFRAPKLMTNIRVIIILVDFIRFRKSSCSAR